MGIHFTLQDRGSIVLTLMQLHISVQTVHCGTKVMMNKFNIYAG